VGIEHPFFLKHITEDLSIHLTERVSVPFTATCFVVILLAALLVAHYTPFGRYIYALGGDEQSATLMGMPVGRTKIFTYTVSGFCSALAGVVYTFYTQSGDPASCVGLELDAIAAVVIGGTLLSGGVGFMAGTAMGSAYPGIDSNTHHISGKPKYLVDAHRRRHPGSGLHSPAKRHHLSIPKARRDATALNARAFI
jgi:galactofuranose transport system permease protein